MAKITRCALTAFAFITKNIGLETAAAGVGNMAFVSGERFTAKRFAVTIDTDEGVRGEYVVNWVGTPSTFAHAGMLAPLLIGRDPKHRERLYDDLKREVRAYDHIGHGPRDIALWDLCGKLRGISIKAMLGGFCDYASSYCGQESPGGLTTPEAFAELYRTVQGRGFSWI